jgi:hypothetical protein
VLVEAPRAPPSNDNLTFGNDQVDPNMKGVAREADQKISLDDALKTIE